MSNDIHAQKSNQENYPKVKNAQVKKVKLKTGTHHYEFKMTNAESWNMIIHTPEIDDANPKTLVLALHWAGGGNTYQDYAECLAIPSFNHVDAIIVAPAGDGRHWIDKHNEYRVIEFIKQAVKYWQVNPEQVIVTGYSNGGIGSWHYGQKYPELISAAIPVAGSYNQTSIQIPVYALHGAKDELFDIEQVTQDLNQSRSAGCDIQLLVLDHLSHYEACQYAPELKKLAKKVHLKLTAKP